MEQHRFVENLIARMEYPHAYFFAVRKSVRVEKVERNIRPQVTEIRIVDFENSFNDAVFRGRFVDFVFFYFFNRIGGTDVFKIDDTRSQARRAVAEQISAVKNCNAFDFFIVQTVDFFVYFAHLGYAHKALNVGKAAVVRRHYIVAVCRFCNAGAARGSDAGVYDRYVYSPLRPKSKALEQAIACAPRIELRKLMSSVHNFKRRIYGFYNAVHRRYGAFFIRKVGLKHQKRFFILHTHSYK